MVHRKWATAWLAAFGLALAGCSQPAGEWAEEAAPPAETFEWTLVTTWPKNLPALGTAPEKLAVLVDEMSAGRLRIKVYGDGELVPAFGVFDAVSAGNAEMGHGAAYYWRGKLPVAALFTTVPFGMTAQEMNAWLHYGGGLELWQELYAPSQPRADGGGQFGRPDGGLVQPRNQRRDGHAGAEDADAWPRRGGHPTAWVQRR